jgi:hypothetical protein
MILCDAGAGCAMAGEVTVLLCRLVSLLPARKGFLLPAPAVELEINVVEMGIVALLLAGTITLLVKKSELVVDCEVAEY